MKEVDLLDLKERIEETKITVSELKGSRKQLMKNLSEEWDCSTVEEAEKKLLDLKGEIQSLDDQIKRKTEELTEKYDVE